MHRSTGSDSERLRAIAHEVVHRLPDQDLRAAFLFGSAAWGDADAASDLDIMLLLDRPAGYREVTRVRLPDLLGRPLPDGPLFADLDRFSAEAFTEVTGNGGWAQRVVHSIVLKDTDQYYARIRDRVSAEFFTAASRAARFQQRRAHVEMQRAAMQAALGSDAILAALHARLALEGAAAALLEINDDRISLTHFVESLEQALANLNHGQLVAPVLHALALDASQSSVDRSLQAYRAFADALKGWVADPDVVGRLSQEDLAWSEFTYGPQTYEEIFHKVAAFTKLGRLPALQYYLDGLLQVPVRLNVGKILLLRSSGTAGRISIPDFHVALHAEPGLFKEWVVALRLGSSYAQAQEAGALADRLLHVGELALQTEA